MRAGHAGRGQHPATRHLPPVASFLPTVQANVTDAFLAFSKSYNLSYESQEDFVHRISIFNDTLTLINEANAAADTFYVRCAVRCAAPCTVRCAVRCALRCSCPACGITCV